MYTNKLGNPMRSWPNRKSKQTYTSTEIELLIKNKQTLSSTCPGRSSCRDVDAQEQSNCNLWTTFPGESDGGQEGCLHAQTPWVGRQKCAQPSHHEGHAVSQIMRLYKGTVFLDTFLLVAYQGGYPVSLRLPPPAPEIVPATLCRSHPETGSPWPKGLEGEWLARLTWGKLTETPTDTVLCSPGADKKAEARVGSATEFQFRGGFGCGQPLSKVGNCFMLNKLIKLIKFVNRGGKKWTDIGHLRGSVG